VATQFRLINGSGRVVYPNDLCKLHATKKNSFDLANLGDIIIGTATQQVSPGSWCVLNPQGVVDWSNVMNKPPKSPRIFINITQPEVTNLIPGDTWIIPSQT
jgi:hypothetical protein